MAQSGIKIHADPDGFLSLLPKSAVGQIVLFGIILLILLLGLGMIRHVGISFRRRNGIK